MTNIVKKILKSMIKSYIRVSGTNRILFVGKRLRIRHIQWLHFNNHPYETLAKEE